MEKTSSVGDAKESGLMEPILDQVVIQTYF